MVRFKSRSIFMFLFIFLFGCSRTDTLRNKDAATPQGITVNKISFEEVTEDKVPDNMINTINSLKSNRGYLVNQHNGYYYIAVFSGKKSTGGYSIKVLSIEDNEGKTNILAEENTPPEGAIVTQAITYPYTVIRVSGITPDINIKTSKGETLNNIMNSGEVY